MNHIIACVISDKRLRFGCKGSRERSNMRSLCGTSTRLWVCTLLCSLMNQYLLFTQHSFLDPWDLFDSTGGTISRSTGFHSVVTWETDTQHVLQLFQVSPELTTQRFLVQNEEGYGLLGYHFLWQGLMIMGHSCIRLTPAVLTLLGKQVRSERT
jgi:hypothetical protein